MLRTLAYIYLAMVIVSMILINKRGGNDSDEVQGKLMHSETFMSAAGQYQDRNYSVIANPAMAGTVSPLISRMPMK
jgi:hypothetical protein